MPASSTYMKKAANGSATSKSKREAGPEADWIERCQGGDSAAFGLLVEKYQRRVLSVVFHLVQRADHVEDLAQEIFVKAFFAIRTYNFQASFGTWLSRIAVNHCYDYLRRERASRVTYYGSMSEEHWRELEAGTERPEAGGLSPDDYVALRELVGKLLARAPREDRVVLTLKELEGLSVQEIAEILEVKPGTVKVRLHRARKRMLEDLRRLRQRGR